MQRERHFNDWKSIILTESYKPFLEILLEQIEQRYEDETCGVLKGAQALVTFTPRSPDSIVEDLAVFSKSYKDFIPGSHENVTAEWTSFCFYI